MSLFLGILSFSFISVSYTHLTDILIPGIMEHIERTGIHSGDSISVYPAPTISEPVKEMIVEYTKRLAQALHVIGLQTFCQLYY